MIFLWPPDLRQGALKPSPQRTGDGKPRGWASVCQLYMATQRDGGKCTWNTGKLLFKSVCALYTINMDVQVKISVYCTPTWQWFKGKMMALCYRADLRAPHFWSNPSSKVWTLHQFWGWAPISYGPMKYQVDRLSISFNGICDEPTLTILSQLPTEGQVH